MSLPLVEELTTPPEPYAALRAFAGEASVLLLESARRLKRLGRYSFLTADPYAFFQIDQAQYGDDPFAAVKQQLQSHTAETLPDLPPFQGGAAGLLAYNLGGCWERLPRPGIDEFQLPALAIGLYDWVIAWDHDQQRAWVISQGFPEHEPAQRRRRAEERMRWVQQTLTKTNSDDSQLDATPSLQAIDLSQQHEIPGRSPWLSNFSRDGYLRTVERAIEYIYAGDIFQVNLSQRLLHPLHESPLELYGRLRRQNAAPFAGYFAHDDWTLASASPERFVQVQDRIVSSRPIKGTRQRRSQPEADLFTRDELRESEKDQAENVMIVDLLRNDLSRVCSAGTIQVPELCRVETYETVQHLVSEIRGTLAPTNDCWDLLAASFPGGSITGAPKVRAMEIIAELEPTVRGPYCGSLFYVGYDGTMDSNILIRTFTARNGWLQCPVGGGIVAQSSPQAEYEETWHKAAGMLAAVGSRQ
ncbi:Aminodeoxychorismate synthase component 1 [Symmachiella dynata]|uniref:aminodeoxychorismate synthase n=1 Tax=Symmachiella dynata TaxID=2527995 RepID=A0A517ZM11_9PLAN|nr:aminodeoxychorismate synthase component I [Symmachiella dynata]QDU43523.1 Aminodeoxychorismate synthase component 1 [Symmachiella dynata]